MASIKSRAYSQSSEHVTRRDGIDTNSGVCPLDSQTGSQVTDSSLGSVVWSLWLWNVDDRTRHATNHDNGARSLSLQEVLCDTNGEEVCSVNVDTPQLLDTVVWVVDGVEVLGETSRGDQVVDLAVVANDILDTAVNGLRVGDIGVVSSDLWNPV